MIGWNEGVTNAISYIEGNLDKELDIKDIADKAYVSAFYFQKIFHVLCEFTVGEYIRNRRLTLAAEELASTDARVIDVALKYGYDAPDSFGRVFTRFHGITPSAAKLKGAHLNSFAPLKIKLTLEGGKDFEYLIADNYIPWNEIPEGCVTRVLPAGTWAVFPCRGTLPKALQDVNTKIWSEWLPSCKTYKLSGNYNIEMYTPICDNPDDNYSEIWVPVEKI